MNGRSMRESGGLMAMSNALPRSSDKFCVRSSWNSETAPPSPHCRSQLSIPKLDSVHDNTQSKERDFLHSWLWYNTFKNKEIQHAGNLKQSTYKDHCLRYCCMRIVSMSMPCAWSQAEWCHRSWPIQKKWLKEFVGRKETVIHEKYFVWYRSPGVDTLLQKALLT